MKFKLIFVFFLFVAAAFSPSYADDTNSSTSSITDVDELPPLYKLLKLNQLFPGYAQKKMGFEQEAKWYTAYWPLYAAGTALTAIYLYNRFDAVKDSDYTWIHTNHNTYMFYHEDFQTNNQRWMMYVGTACFLAASLIQTYSEYAAIEDYEDFAAGRTSGRLTLGDFLKAPYQMETLKGTGFFPMYPLTVLLQFRVTDYAKIGDYFRRETVPFLGAQVNPWAGLGLAAASSLLFVTMNATWEEIFFRGIMLKDKGKTSSSIWFGSAHILNFAYPNVSMEDTALQTVFAGLFGYYAAVITERNNGDIRPAIALHFWHNVTTLILDYLMNPDDHMLFSIGFNVEF